MGARHRVIVIALAAVVACRKPPPEGKADAGPPPPTDRLADGEMAEGREKAFGLPLPRAARVALRFQDSIQVTSSLAPEQLANFVRARVTKGKVLTGTTVTTFEDVIVPAEPARHITIEVRAGKPLSGTRSEMVVKDVTPPPPPDPNESESDRRKKAGLTPDGKLIDPKHIQ